MPKRGSSLSQARAAKAKLQTLLRKHPTVNGIGITRLEQGYGVKLNLSAPRDDRIPDEVDGVPIQVETVGPIVKRRAATT